MVEATPAEAPPAPALRLGGMTPLTTIDFPGRLAAVLYCQGCPWRCGSCHNPELLDATQPPLLPWAQALAFLESRRGLLDGVVFSGGEPTLQAGLGVALNAVRSLGLQTALHTGGTVLHLYMGERVSSGVACRELVRRALTNFRLPYITVTPTFSICPTHGYLAGEHPFCPRCDDERLDAKRRRLAA